MKDKKILRKISQGMYILTTNGGGCFVDAVSQVSAGDNPLIAVAVMKNNNTNLLMHENDKFAISIFGMNDDTELIKTYGMNSMRDFDKFANSKVEEIDGINIIPDSLGYIICEKVDTIENETHTLFIGKIIEADKFNDSKEMTYGYYQEHKEDILKVKTQKGETAWVCMACGYVYYGEELPDDFRCPVCQLGKEMFKKKED
jgi:flavin reductase (DIM6/NTAB) family NADH-FMN oxidoreductase RutF/rubredoxin